MKLDFEIAVVQQTRARDRTFEGVPDSWCPPVTAGQPRPYLVNLWPNFAKSPKHALGDLLVATSLLNTFISKLDKNWLSYEQNTV